MSATLQGIVRDKKGSRYARRLRLQNRIPCSIQGEGKGNLEISIDEDEFMTARRQHEHLFDIEFEGGEPETALVRELQWSTFGETILHVEFRRVVRGQKTEVEVPLEFLGHPKGGVLNHLFTHIPVRCLPSQMPDVIEVKVDELEEGHPLHMSDVQLPEGSEAVLPPETQLAIVSAVRAVEETTEGEGAEDAGGEAAPAADAPAPE